MRQKGQSINGFTNHFWNGVTTVYLAEIIHIIVSRDLYGTGIFHIFSDEVVSKFELLVMINHIYDLGITINRFETPRSYNRTLYSEKALCKQVVHKSLRQQIEEMRRFFEQSHLAS